MKAKLQAIGRLGRDPQLRDTKSSQVLSFSVAADTGWGDNKNTLWINCSLWGKRAESMNNLIRKGTLLEVDGEPSLEEYEAKDGTMKTTLKLNVSTITLIADWGKNSPAGEPDDDLPF